MIDISSLPDAHLRIFERPPVPPDVKDVYFVGICGTGMGSLAGLFKHAGFRVRGSDQHVYPPMSTRLEKEGITVDQGYDPAHLDPPPDLVVIGNACTPTHPEAAFARDRRLVQQSFPEALAHFFLKERRSLVVAGTHGKTTTTGMLIHVFRHLGYDPGFLVGGVMQHENTSYHPGSGPHFIVEGDEYDSAYFDKRPKFMHYRPASAIVTSMELDHTDIYPDWPAYRQAFASFASTVSRDGALVLCSDYPAVANLADHTEAPVFYYGLKPRPGFAERYIRAERTSLDHGGQTFSLFYDDCTLTDVYLPMHGDHNLSNATAVCALAMAEGIAAKDLPEAFRTYRGMKRRQEVRDEIAGVLVLDDFAHHPTAVRETLKAVKQAYPSRRLIAVFEPRSNSSRRRDFQDVYVEAFDAAQEVILSAPPFRHNDARENFLDIDGLVQTITRRGIPAQAFTAPDDVLAHLVKRARPGDVVLIMSNGGFGGLHDKFLRALRTRAHSKE